MGLVADLQSRGLLHQVSDPRFDEKIDLLKQRGPVAAYVGFDPTADSLHIGNFVGILCLMHAQRNGIRPIGLVGGATGLIGDPSGKSAERQLQAHQTVADNAVGIQKVLERFLDFHHPSAPASIVSNLDWFGPMSAIDFLRDVGKHFRVGSMLAKESVRARMENSQEGMSYTEFSYQLLQGYDFYRLYKDRHVVVQLGGSDQWGNITAGADLIRKLEGESGNAFAITAPLITTSSGQKFGKSEGNAVWLSSERTRGYDFYQFWLRTEDADVERYLKLFTFLPLEEIQRILSDHSQSPQQRIAQRRLADEVMRMVHGPEACGEAQRASQAMFASAGEKRSYDDAAIAALAEQVPAITLERARLDEGWPLIDAAVACGLAKSKSDARRLISQGGLYVNDVAMTDVNASLNASHLATGRAIVLRGGKKNHRLVLIG